jgi:hypothetical protein
MARRFEMRRKLSRPIEVISAAWDEAIGFATGDLSPRGVYVESEILPELGEHVVCSFDLGPERAFDLFAEVVRVNLMRRHADERLWPGFGLRFMDAKPLDRIKIRDALRNLPPMPMMRRPPRAGALMAPPGLLWAEPKLVYPPRLPRIA